MKIALDIFTIVAVMAGAFFFLAGTVGLLRFPDPLTRLHALTKADNLGLGLVVLGLLPQTDWPLDTIKLVTIWLFALLAGATVGQLMACAARRGGSNAVGTLLPPNGGKSEAKGALGGGRSEGNEASDLTRPHPNPPSWGDTAIKLSRHSGMDRRTNRQDSRFARLRRPKGEGQGCSLLHPDCRDANNLCHPWSLGSGDPCRNDEFFLNSTALHRGPPT